MVLVAASRSFSPQDERRFIWHKPCRSACTANSPGTDNYCSLFQFVCEKTYRSTLQPAHTKSNVRGILGLEKEAAGLAGICSESVFFRNRAVFRRPITDFGTPWLCRNQT